MDKKVLVVEDERSLSEAIISKLKKNNFSTFSAKSVGGAVDILSKEPIDAIWLDHYLLGKENGLDLVLKLKTNDLWKNIPIFVVSNTATLDKVKSYLSLGIKRFFTKSDFKLEQIISDVSNCVRA